MEKIEKELLRRLTYYIQLNPKNLAYEVSAKTGVSMDMIDLFIECGLIEKEGGELKLPTKRKTLNVQEKSKLINGIENCKIDKVNELEREEKKQESKLVIDLKNLNTKVHNNDIGER